MATAIGWLEIASSNLCNNISLDLAKPYLGGASGPGCSKPG